MVFNPDKCEHIQITNKRNVIPTSYSIHGQTLKETSKAKYLGVTIDSKLSWNSHIDAVTKRANQTTAFLRRNLSSCPKDVKAKCYKSIVRPQLEYASTVWDPVTKSNIAKLESVQRRAARFCCNDLPPNQQCHFNVARTWMGGPSIKARPEQSHNDVQDRQ